MSDRTPDQNKALTTTVLEHYLKHHELVLKKLILVQKATQMSIDKLALLSSATSPDEFDTIWDETIEMFKNCGISEEELFAIEDVLVKTPKSIKDHYQTMVDEDLSIQTLLKEIDREKYEQAMDAIKEVQGKSNPMTGLGPEEYEDAHETQNRAIDALKPEKPSGKKSGKDSGRDWWKPEKA